MRRCDTAPQDIFGFSSRCHGAKHECREFSQLEHRINGQGGFSSIATPPCATFRTTHVGCETLLLVPQALKTAYSSPHPFKVLSRSEVCHAISCVALPMPDHAVHQRAASHVPPRRTPPNRRRGPRAARAPGAAPPGEARHAHPPSAHAPACACACRLRICTPRPLPALPSRLIIYTPGLCVILIDYSL